MSVHNVVGFFHLWYLHSCRKCRDSNIDLQLVMQLIDSLCSSPLIPIKEIETLGSAEYLSQNTISSLYDASQILSSFVVF